MQHNRNKIAKMALAMIALGVTGSAFAEKQRVLIDDGVAIFKPSKKEAAISEDSIARASAMPLPVADPSLITSQEDEVSSDTAGVPGFSPGSTGDGKLTQKYVPPEDAQANEALLDEEIDGIVSPQEYGTANHPFTTMRVDLSSNTVSALYPYRAAGQLYFNDGSTSYVCSASLIKKGVVVTAAHCVAKFGAKKYYTNFQFVPARYQTLAPYGTWLADTAAVMASYYDGTDSCAQKGVVCKNDVAVIRLAAQSSKYPGTSTGWFGYGWDGAGFATATVATTKVMKGTKITLVNQLGYPVSHDQGLMMQRTDSQGFLSATMSNNTVWGSRQTGGSSGGPELNNLGISPALSGVATGSAPNANMVIGVTSWGYTDTKVMQQGASPFTSTNIVALVDKVCASNHAACQQ